MSDQITFLNAITSAAPGTAMSFAGAKGASIQVWSAAGSTSTVLIQGSENGTVWATLATITNVALVGETWFGTAMPYIRVNPTVVSAGTISALGHALDTDPGAWHQYAGASATPIALTGVAMTVANLTDSGLTITRVPFASTAGLLVDDSTFVFDSSTKALAASIHKGAIQETVAAKLTDGAITAVPKVFFITKGSALGSSTVANPTATDHDGYVIRFVSTSAYAHVVSFNSGKINGGSNTTVTLTSAAIGDGFTIQAYQGVWYIVATVGTVTVT